MEPLGWRIIASGSVTHPWGRLPHWALSFLLSNRSELRGPEAIPEQHRGCWRAGPGTSKGQPGGSLPILWLACLQGQLELTPNGGRWKLPSHTPHAPELPTTACRGHLWLHEQLGSLPPGSPQWLPLALSARGSRLHGKKLACVCALHSTLPSYWRRSELLLRSLVLHGRDGLRQS